MKQLFIILFVIVFHIEAFARLHAVIITESKTVTLAATPEAIVGSEIFSITLTVQAKSSNTQSVFIGPCSGTQDIELAAGSNFSISDIFRSRKEVDLQLDKICLRVGVNGEGANIIYTKILVN